MLSSKVEAIILASTFVGLATVALAVALLRKYFNLREHLYKFLFTIIILAQLSIRACFFSFSIFSDTSDWDDFWVDFPSMLFNSLCCVQILQWLEAMELHPKGAVVSLIVNSVMYTLYFISYGIGKASDSHRLALMLYTAINCLASLGLISAIIYYVNKTYLLNSNITYPKQEWTLHKKSILFCFAVIAAALSIRILSLLEAALKYDNALSLDIHNKALLLIYYLLCEAVPVTCMILLQLKFPSRVMTTPYGELEKMIIQIRNETPQEDLIEKVTCKICLEREINTAFLPCKHSCACDYCGKSLTICPLCRSEVMEVLTIFKS